MKQYLLPVLLGLLFPCALYAQEATRLHRKAIIVDAHNDVLSSAVMDGIDISHRTKHGHSDLDRWKEGGLDVQFFSVWTGEKARTGKGFYSDAIQEIDSLNILVLRNPQRVTLALGYRDVKRAIRQGRMAALIGVEGGHMIENDLGKLEKLYDQGMRYLTLTWNNSTEWATSAMDESRLSDTLKRKGLTDFGKAIVRRMNELGIIVDLSHTGEQTFYDALSVTTKPVLLSHSSVWSICPVFRNVKDDQIRAVARNGGVICINFYSGFISKAYDERHTILNGPRKKIVQDSLLAIRQDSAWMLGEWEKYYNAEMAKARPTIDQLIDHIDYIVKMVGDDHVGLGSDYDGVGSLPVGLEDVTTYPRITTALKERGYSNDSIRKILGGNVLRVMKANFRH